MPDPITREDTLNGRLYDDAIVRGVHNLRFREDLVRRAVARLRKHDSEFLNKLAVILVRMSDKDMERIGSSLSLSRATDRTKALVTALRDFSASSTATAMFAADELRELAFDEAEFWAGRVNHHMPSAAGIRVDAPKKSTVNSAWANTLLAGESITDSVKRWGKQRAEIMRSVIRQQAFEGVEATAIIRGLAGRRGFLARNRDGSPNGLGLKLRTATTASMSAGAKMFAAENDLINDLVWVATIDSRTSDICTARHGRLVNKELGGKLPPAHPNCRSLVASGVYNIAAAKRLKKRLPADELDIEGRIPEHETAGKWLARQTEEVQRKVLGPQRLGLYKAGRMKWPEDFLRRDDGHRWTIDELRKRNADFFKT